MISHKTLLRFSFFRPSILIVTILLISFDIYAQSIKEDPVNFKYNTNIGAPDIFVGAYEGGNGIYFVASNGTYYPITVRLTIKGVQNLSSTSFFSDQVVSNGTEGIHSMTVDRPGESYHYDYSYTFGIGSGKSKPDTNYVYLIPLKPGAVPEPSVNGNDTIADSFMLNPGDTVFCVRKGVITAVPGERPYKFRISNRGTVEVLHSDGTLMIYNNVNHNLLNLTQGTTVYPGEPLGVVRNRVPLVLDLVLLNGTNRIRSIPILYSSGDSSGVQYSMISGTTKTVHPEILITREMTKRELKLRAKNQLTKR